MALTPTIISASAIARDPSAALDVRFEIQGEIPLEKLLAPKR